MSVMELFAAFKTMILNFTAIDIGIVFIMPVISDFFKACGHWEEMTTKENRSTIVWFYILTYIWWVLTFTIGLSCIRILHYPYMSVGMIAVIVYTIGYAIIERLLKPFNKKPRQ
jgi:hypothetical protein